MTNLTGRMTAQKRIIFTVCAVNVALGLALLLFVLR
jgi:hypothetical protein